MRVHREVSSHPGCEALLSLRWRICRSARPNALQVRRHPAAMVSWTPGVIAELEAGPGLWIGGLHLHICGARRPGELMLMRLLARKGGAFNYHRLDPRIRLIVVSDV